MAEKNSIRLTGYNKLKIKIYVNQLAIILIIKNETDTKAGHLGV